MKKLRAALIGIGAMGRGHLDNYIRFAKEDYPVELVAICDIDEKKFQGEFLPGNMNVGLDKYDFSKYNLYTDYEEMFKKEQLDYVDIALPTYLHAQASIKAMEAGFHVLCEKPMALNVEECDSMISASERTGKKLMIGQCLRFWPMYEELKRTVEDGRFGKPMCAYFFRGGGTPMWSYQNWLLQKEKAGGALLDQHIHDVDMINWLFGIPQAVSASGVTQFETSVNDAVSTNYIYGDKVVNAQDDWFINGEYGFSMIYRVNFQKGALVLDKGKVTVYPHEGKSYEAQLAPGDGYYHEMVYFTQAILHDTPIEKCTPWSTRETIRIAQAEAQSAQSLGQVSL